MSLRSGKLPFLAAKMSFFTIRDYYLGRIPGKILLEESAMHTDRRLLLLFLAFSFAVMSLPILAQQVIATVPAGYEPGAVQVNPVTNKIYVANFGDSTVSVIDGATN